MKKWTILLVLQGLFFAAEAQNVKVFGYVKDSLSGETLLGANIYAPTEGVGVASNNFGFYTLEVPQSLNSESFREIKPIRVRNKKAQCV